MHVHCLHWLMSTGLLFQNAFCRSCKSTTGKMVPKGGLQFGCGDLILLSLSVHVSLGLVAKYWPFMGTCTYHICSKLYYLCHLASLFKLLLPPTTLPHSSYPPPYIHCPNINEFHAKTWKKQPLSTCQVNCTQINR